MGDDHYIADIHNAHIDTGEFEALLLELAQGATGQALDHANLPARIHALVIERLSGSIEQPHDDALICRYLTPAKFLWFLRGFRVYFGSAREFEDKTDCAVPVDYNRSVQRFLLERSVLPIAWDEYAEGFRSEWLVSSWTELTDYYDDHLLWHRYAAGPAGVGITIRYGLLHQFLSLASDRMKLANFASGRVSYGEPLRIPPFSKRRLFKNEKEVRFVCRGEALAAVDISIAPLKDRLGLRFSPDAPKHHVEAIMETWIKCGGNERYQIAGD